MSPFAGLTIASRFDFVILGINNPFVVDFISSKAEASGVVVPIPALPVEGNVLVCALVLLQMMQKMNEQMQVRIFFIMYFFRPLNTGN
jgi:hypothetical protein